MKIIAVVLSVTMLTGAVVFGAKPVAVSAATGAVMPINSITYDFTISGAATETSLKFEAQTVNWDSPSYIISPVENGDCVFTVNFTGTINNLGFVDTVAGSGVTMKLNSITVNRTYVFTFTTPPLLQVGSSTANGLPNIWNTGITDGSTLYTSDDGGAYFVFNYNKDILFYVQGGGSEPAGPVMSTSRSTDYAAAMGSGWNLGNTFDGFDADLDKPDLGETAWGNPEVTPELIQSIKDKGFDSIRIPMTVYRRYTVNNDPGAQYKYAIDPAWLEKYKKVVDWAVDDGLYVVINIHHDSWYWLANWNGATSAAEYQMFTQFWEQIAAYFADEPDYVSFETINEPMNTQQELDALNKAAYDIIRSTTGNTDTNKTRIILIPTLGCDPTKSASLPSFINGLDDENIIATVHYYSTWVYSANLGRTSFDEYLWPWDTDNPVTTARVDADILFSTIKNNFTDNGIGCVIGEYGLLGYDTSDEVLQTGEELKYYEYMSELARENGTVSLMFWDNGSGIDRTDDSNDYPWSNPRVGAMMDASNAGERSSYSTGLDTIYFNHVTASDVSIPLTLNGNAFEGITGLVEGVEYTYDAGTAIVTLSRGYVNKMYEAMDTSYGTFATLEMTFSSGAAWNEYLVKYSDPVFNASAGTKSGGIEIPVTYNGSRVRRVVAYEEGVPKLNYGGVPYNVMLGGNNSGWWPYLNYATDFNPKPDNGTFAVDSHFFNDSRITDGVVTLLVEFYDGQILEVNLTVSGDTVTAAAIDSVTITDLPDGQVGTAYSQELSSTTSTAAWTLYSGSLPDGLTLSPAGAISGTPTTGGTYTFTVKADGAASSDISLTIGGYILLPFTITNGVNGYSQELSINIVQPVTGIVLNPQTKEMTSGDTASLTATVGPSDATNTSMTWSSSDPAVVTVDKKGVITAAATGTSVITVTTEDGQYTAQCVVTVTAAPGITGVAAMSLLTGYAATSSGALAITGFPEAEVSVTSAVSNIGMDPAELMGYFSWDDAYSCLNILPGLSAGGYTVTLTASNGVEPDAALEFTLTVTETPFAPEITSLDSAIVEAGKNFQVTASGTAPISFALSEGVPNGVTIDENTGVITVCADVQAGDYTFTIIAGNGTAPDAAQTFILTVTAVAVHVDKSLLQALAGEAGLLVKDDYAIETWTPFETALEAAKAVLTDPDATQEGVDAALAALQAASNALEKAAVPAPADKTALQNQIYLSDALAKTDYTAETWAPFEASLKAAKAVLANPDATQEKVNAALSTLLAAIGDLHISRPIIDPPIRDGGYLNPPSAVTISENAAPQGYIAMNGAQIQKSYADALYKLKLFLGADPNSSVPVYNLEQPLTRIQALILVIRLMGLEADAQAFMGDRPFSDVPEWAAKYAAFGYDKGITVGVNDTHTLFAPDDQVTFQQFTAFLLRVLGYNEKNGDFAYAEALAKAIQLKLFTGSESRLLGEGKFLRGDAVIAMSNALLTYMKDSRETKLIDSLVSRRLFTQEAADAFVKTVQDIGKYGA